MAGSSRGPVGVGPVMAGREVNPGKWFNPDHVPIRDRANDPDQKKAVIDRLLDVWLRHPELRLGQLIGNLYSRPSLPGNRIYNDEDFEFIANIENFYKPGDGDDGKTDR